MNVLLITPWGDHCGIAEHSAQLVEATRAADSDLVYEIDPDLHPSHVLCRPLDGFPKLIVLNYHAALLSQWHASHIKDAQAMGAKVLVIYHDTGIPNTDQCKRLWEVADAFIVHEPGMDDLPGAIYWRMGVPAYSGKTAYYSPMMFARPTLGTIGHNFGWKNWPELAKITRAVGWGFLILTPEMSEADEQALQAINPWLDVRRALPNDEAIETLHACDATAFVNVCANAGQSAAILMGIAARKPVIALSSCRQYRALHDDPVGQRTIRWASTFEDVQDFLRYGYFAGRFDTGIVALAEQESWEHLGRKYADLYRELGAR